MTQLTPAFVSPQLVSHHGPSHPAISLGSPTGPAPIPSATTGSLPVTTSITTSVISCSPISTGHPRRPYSADPRQAINSPLFAKQVHKQGRPAMPTSLRQTQDPAPHQAHHVNHHMGSSDHATQDAQAGAPSQGKAPQANAVNTGHSALRFALSSATAAGVAAASTYPFSAAVSRGIAHDMRLPTPADIALHGIPTTAARAIIQTGLIESIRPPVKQAALQALAQLPGTNNLDTKKRQISAEVLALLGTSLIVTLITTPIENLAMMQNQSGKSLLCALGEVLKDKPGALFSAVSSTFISMNISWGMRLYARMQAEGNAKKEEKISERLAGINGPIKNFLRCVNSRQMVHNEALALAMLGTLKTMASKPVNTIALIAMNIAIGAMMGTKIYHGVRDRLNTGLAQMQRPSDNAQADLDDSSKPKVH